MYIIFIIIIYIIESVILFSLYKVFFKNYLEEVVFFEIIVKFSKWC